LVRRVYGAHTEDLISAGLFLLCNLAHFYFATFERVTGTMPRLDATNTKDTKVKELDVVKRTKERAAGAHMAPAALGAYYESVTLCDAERMREPLLGITNVK